jgi:hypothetical protein
VLPLVTGGGAGGQGVTPFIEIPTSRAEEETQITAVDNSTTTSATPASSIQTRLNPLT